MRNVRYNKSSLAESEGTNHKANKMRQVYRTIVQSPEFEAASHQMAAAGFPAVAIIEAITEEQDFREFSPEEVARAQDAIRTVVARQF